MNDDWRPSFLQKVVIGSKYVWGLTLRVCITIGVEYKNSIHASDYNGQPLHKGNPPTGTRSEDIRIDRTLDISKKLRAKTPRGFAHEWILSAVRA